MSATARRVWEKVVRKLRTGAMPPAGMPRPDKAAYDSFATYLEDGARPRGRSQAQSGQAGRPSPQPRRIHQRHPRLAGA